MLPLRPSPMSSLLARLTSSSASYAYLAQDDLVYVPSDVLKGRAKARGIPPNKLLQFGLPVRDAFW